MTFKEVMSELKSYGNENTKRTYANHGAKEPFYGVKAGDLKKILKKTKKNHALSLELFNTGNSDAMYLAALMADEKEVTEEQLDDWVNKAYWYYLSQYAVPWVAGDSPFGFQIGLKWIQSDKDNISTAGWAALSSFAGVNPDENLDIPAYSDLLDVVQAEIHDAPNRTRFAMNDFVIAIGSYVKALTPKAKSVGESIGQISVEMASKACKVPLAIDYIKKVEDKGRLGKKRKTARC